MVKNSEKQVVTRFAPSSTGLMHLGGLRTALYNYYLAKQNDGKFILRIEDTDQSRCKPEYEQNIKDVLLNFGIKWDEEYKQSERLSIYQQYADELIERDLAYYCTCKNNETDCHCSYSTKPTEPYTIKVKFPKDITLSFVDHVRGKIDFDSNLFDSQIIIKSDGFPTYHFAVVVDDHLMGVTHVLRGDEWMTSCPKHSFIYRLFGWSEPVWCHLPVLLNPDKTKMSKRYGDYSVNSFLEKGYFKETLINFISYLGWTPGNNADIHTLDELIELFNIDNITTSGSIFDEKQLDNMNREYLKSDDIVISDLVSEYYFDNIPEELIECNADDLFNSFMFFRDHCTFLKEIYQKTIELKKSYTICDVDLLELGKEVIGDFREEIEYLSESFQEKHIEEIIEKTIEKHSNKKIVYGAIRTVLTGKKQGGDIPKISKILGKEEILRRIVQSQQTK